MTQREEDRKLEGHNLLATDFPFAFFSSIDNLRASLRRALASSFWSYALNPLSSSTFFSSGGGGLRFPACASGCPSTPNIVPEAVAATNHLQHNVPNTFLHESRSNVSNCIEKLGKYSLNWKFPLGIAEALLVYTGMYKIANERELKEILWETWQRETQIMFVFLSWRSSTGKDWGLTRGEFQVLHMWSCTQIKTDRKRGKKPTCERHQKQLLGIGHLPADIQAVDKPWSWGWVCIQPNLCCGIHTVLIAKQWSKRIQKLTSPLLPLQVSWRSSSHFISANQEQC